MEAIPVPLGKFSQVNVDLVGLWPGTTEGHTHLLTVVDRTTEAIPLLLTTAQVVADSFVVNWVARFGVSATITTIGYWCHVAIHVQGPRSQPRVDNRLPPPVQRDGEALPPAAEGGATCQVQQSGLARAPSLGVVGSLCCPKGRSWCFSSGGHIWAFSGVAKPVTAAFMCTASHPTKVVIPSTVKPTKETEKARQEASHIYVHEGVVIDPRTTVHTACSSGRRRSCCWRWELLGHGSL